MLRLLLFFTAFFISVWLGVLIKNEPGYFLIMVNQFSIEMPLWVGAFLAVLVFITLHYLINLFGVLGQCRMKLLNWLGQRKMNYAHSHTTKGILALTEGQWVLAEKHAIKAIPNSDCKLIDYLVAARAAQYQNAIDRRDRYIRQAKKVAPQEKIAVELTQAQLQIDSGQYEQALATVKHLHHLMPKHVYIVKMLQQLYIKLEDWSALIILLPDITKSGAVTASEFDALERLTFLSYFDTHTFLTLNEVEDFWMRSPKSVRKIPKFILSYCRWLNHFGEFKACEMHLKIALKRELDNDLIELYSRTQGPNPAQQLQLAEHWLMQQPYNATLLAALARLSIICEYWGKAKDYFKESLAQQFNKDVCAEYAKLLHKLGEKDLALSHYQKAFIQENQ